MVCIPSSSRTTSPGAVLVYDITKLADARFPTSVTGDTARNLQVAYMNPLSLYSLLLECTLHFMQSRCRIAVSLRATIEDNNSHTI